MRRTQLGRVTYRYLKREEPDPEGAPREYRQSDGSYLLRWKVGVRSYVERYAREADGSLKRWKPRAARIDAAAIYRLYEQGATLTEISGETGWDTGALSRALRRAGYTLRTSADYGTPIDVQRLIYLYTVEGRSIHDAARAAGVENTVKAHRLLREAGVVRRPGRPSGHRNSTYETELRHMRGMVECRSGGFCEAGASPKCTGDAVHVHHRKRRSQGGDNSMANLLHVCFACHGWIHAHPRESYEAGWLVHAWDEPVEIDHHWGASA